MSVVDGQELVQREIERDPYRPGSGNARLRRSGVHVWAIVNYYLNTVDGDAEAVARDYALSLDEVKAALRYYQSHRKAIDTIIAANELAFVE